MARAKLVAVSAMAMMASAVLRRRPSIPAISTLPTPASSEGMR